MSDIVLKVKKAQIDILLVVNIFLTSFDSCPLNALYVDKYLEYHNLLQAFSRNTLSFLKLSCQNATFICNDIHQAVNEIFSRKQISERTIRYHLTLLGFSHVQRCLKEELFQDKKN